MAVLLIEAVIALVLIRDTTQESLKSIINEEFSQTIELVENEFSFLEQSNIYMANSIIMDSKSLKTIKIDDAVEQTNVDNIILLDSNGEIIRQAGLFQINGQNLQTYHIVHQVMHTKKASSAIERVDDIFVFYTAVPIMDDGVLLGELLVGLQLSNRVLHEMSKGSTIHLAIVGDRAIGASSLDLANKKRFVLLPVDYIEYLMLLEGKIDLLETKIEEKEYFVKARKLRYVDKDTTNASLMLLYDAKHYNQQLATINTIQYSLILVMLISIFITVLFISKHLKRAFAKLIRAFKNVAEGNYGELVQIDTHDELESLAYYFNQMSISIKKKDDEIQKHIFDLEKKIQHISQLKESEKILYEKATVDSLTQLYNREKFKDLFDYMIKKSYREETSVVLAILDIDFFKRVNDTFGHLVGDSVLKEIAQILRTTLRETDLIARWGGEEFIVAISVRKREEAALVLQKLIDIVAAHKFETVGEVTCSCGYTFYNENEDNDTLFQRADEALYQAKINGRNRLEVKI